MTEADIEEFIDNLFDGEDYPDGEFSDNDDNDGEVFVIRWTQMRTLQMAYDL